MPGPSIARDPGERRGLVRVGPPATFHHVRAHRVHLDGLASRRVGVVDEAGLRGPAVPDVGRQRGRHVIVDRADARPDQPVDQRALALFELSGDDNVDRRVDQSTSEGGESGGQIPPTVRLACLHAQIDELRRPGQRGRSGAFHVHRHARPPSVPARSPYGSASPRGSSPNRPARAVRCQPHDPAPA